MYKNMNSKLLNRALLLAILSMSIFSCNKKNEEPAPTGVKGVVTDGSTSEVLSGVRVVLFDANTNQATDNITTTDVDGTYSFEAVAGSYFITLTKQGYSDVPTRGVSALPFSIVSGSQLDNPVQMFANGASNIGWIAGKLTSTDASVAGSLVVATTGANGYSTISDSEGNYIIYNVPAATYNVKAWKAEVNSPEVSATVTADTETSDVNLAISLTTGATVTGTITFLATANIEVDVALTHPVTEEAIPGLNTITSNGSYSLPLVPDGEYLARASYSNDGVVMDPDWIMKNGEPFVRVSGVDAIRNFSVTNAVSLTSPTNTATSIDPVISSSVPTFTWLGYSSTSDYVIEVSDENGNVIWGGFSTNWTVKNITIPAAEISIDFNSDGNATESLVSGNVYRWRVYASKNNVQSLTGWELISVSEDQQGLIIIE